MKAIWVLLGVAVVGFVAVSWLVGGDEGPPQAPPPQTANPDVPTSTRAELALDRRPSAAPARPDAQPPAVDPGPAPEIGAQSPLKGLDGRDLDAAERARLSIPEEVKGGWVVRSVDPTSPAAEAHLEKDDVITRAHKTNVMTFDDLARAIGDREHTIIRVYRRGQPFEVVLQKPWE
jgi:hypothetical protein